MVGTSYGRAEQGAGYEKIAAPVARPNWGRVSIPEIRSVKRCLEEIEPSLWLCGRASRGEGGGVRVAGTCPCQRKVEMSAFPPSSDVRFRPSVLPLTLVDGVVIRLADGIARGEP